MAGNIFGYQKALYQKIEYDLVDKEEVDEDGAKTSRKMKK